MKARRKSEGINTPVMKEHTERTDFRRGDRVSWNSEAGRVSGTIIKKVTAPINFKGYVHHASKDEPQYFIKSDKTDHIALHKGSPFTLIRRHAAPKSHGSARAKPRAKPGRKRAPGK